MISSEFRKEISQTDIGKTINYCYQCGTCAGICPAFRVNSNYNPRRLVEEILLGFKEKLLHDKNIWLCTTCHGCLEVCPQGVMVSEMLFELRHKAVEVGNIPESIREEGVRFSQTGLNIPPSAAIGRRREKLGLNAQIMTPIVENIKILLEEVDFFKLIENKNQEAESNE
ncbi:MAG: 4Fe-4S dicluster domain-containing protein [Candidatus Helarchaeota archaeon]